MSNPKAARYYVYMRCGADEVVPATHPCGEPMYRVGMDPVSVLNAAKQDARDAAARSPGDVFVVTRWREGSVEFEVSEPIDGVLPFPSRVPATDGRAA